MNVFNAKTEARLAVMRDIRSMATTSEHFDAIEVVEGLLNRVIDKEVAAQFPTPQRPYDEVFATAIATIDDLTFRDEAAAMRTRMLLDPPFRSTKEFGDWAQKNVKLLEQLTRRIREQRKGGR